MVSSMALVINRPPPPYRLLLTTSTEETTYVNAVASNQMAAPMSLLWKTSPAASSL